MLCTAEQSEAGQSGAEAAARVGDEVQREARARFKGSGAGDRGVQLRKGIPGGCAGDLGCGCCAEQERKEEEAPDLWASTVSG